MAKLSSRFVAAAASMLIATPLARAGTLQTLYAFKGGTDLAEPYSHLTVHDGLIYGMALKGGDTRCHKRGCGGFYAVDPITGTTLS